MYAYACVRIILVALAVLLFLFISLLFIIFFFFFQAEDGIRDLIVTGVQTCALPIYDQLQRMDQWHSGPFAATGHPPDKLDRQPHVLIALMMDQAGAVSLALQEDRKSVV